MMLVESGVVIISYAELDYIIGHGYSWWATTEHEMHGKNKLDAIRQSAELRMRPILMTTGAMVLGAVPLALATGA